MRILLVDDEEELVTALAERLEMRDFDADWATSGTEAVKKAKVTTYDVFVLDLKMPGQGGLEIMRQIRAFHPDAGFIFLTGHGSAEGWEMGKAEGVRHYLAKPVNIEVLIGKLREAAGKPPGL
jgi:DNA-binding response OmpR family regulator